jgi:hypothetical protein
MIGRSLWAGESRHRIPVATSGSLEVPHDEIGGDEEPAKDGAPSGFDLRALSPELEKYQRGDVFGVVRTTYEAQRLAEYPIAVQIEDRSECGGIVRFCSRPQFTLTSVIVGSIHI